MNKHIAAILVFITLTMAAYLSGRGSIREERVPAPEPTPESSDAAPKMRSREFRLEETPRVAFTDLYESLRFASHERRGELVRELGGISNERKKKAAILSFFKCLVMVDVDDALGLLSELKRDDDQIAAVGGVIKGAHLPATPRLVKMLMTLPGEVGDRCRENICRARSAFGAHSTRPPRRSSSTITRRWRQRDRSAYDWAGIDPAAAEAWLGRHPELSSDPSALMGFVSGVYDSDPELARQYVINNANDERFQRIIGPMASHSFLASSEAAEKFIGSLPNGEARRLAIGEIARLNMDLLAGADRPGPRDFSSVGDWILKFPADDREGSVANLLYHWEKVDPGHTQEWISKVAPENQQQVIDEYTQALNLEGLRRTLASPNESLRARILSSVARRLGNTRAEQERTLSQPGLAPEEAELLARIVREQR
jgi:hypothetical protein